MGFSTLGGTFDGSTSLFTSPASGWSRSIAELKIANRHRAPQQAKERMRLSHDERLGGEADKERSRVLLLITLMALFCSSCSSDYGRQKVLNAPAETTPHVSQEHAVIYRGVTSDDLALSRRCIQMIGEDKNRYADIDGKFLISQLSRPENYFVRGELIRALVQRGNTLVPDYIQALKSGSTGEAQQAIMVCLGRLGNQASAAVWTVVDLLGSPGGTRECRIAARICYDNLGYNLEENREQIRDEITSSDDDAAAAGLRAIYMTKACGVLDPAILIKLVRPPEGKPTEESAYAAMIYAECGRRDPAASKAIEHLLAESATHTHFAAFQVFFGIALFELDPQGHEWAIRQTLAHIGSEDGFGRLEIAAAESVIPYLDDGGRLVRYLTKMLGSADADVQIGSANLLGVYGLRGSVASERAISLLRISSDERVRTAMASALGSILDSSKVGELKRILKIETSASVKSALARSINIIEMSE